MHRTDLLNLLSDYQLGNPDEADTTDRFINFVQRHADCCERTLQIGHITGSAWVMNHARSHALLTHHRKLNCWLQLGGHADGDTDILRVAQREVQEESGLAEIVPLITTIFDLDAHRIPARGTEPAHVHYDVRFLLQAQGDESLVVSAESHDLAWVEINEINSYSIDASILRMVDKWRKWAGQ